MGSPFSNGVPPSTRLQPTSLENRLSWMVSDTDAQAHMIFRGDVIDNAIKLMSCVIHHDDSAHDYMPALTWAVEALNKFQTTSPAVVPRIRSVKYVPGLDDLADGKKEMIEMLGSITNEEMAHLVNYPDIGYHNMVPFVNMLDCLIAARFGYYNRSKEELPVPGGRKGTKKQKGAPAPSISGALLAAASIVAAPATVPELTDPTILSSASVPASSRNIRTRLNTIRSWLSLLPTKSHHLSNKDIQSAVDLPLHRTANEFLKSVTCPLDAFYHFEMVIENAGEEMVYPRAAAKLWLRQRIRFLDAAVRLEKLESDVDEIVVALAVREMARAKAGKGTKKDVGDLTAKVKAKPRKIAMEKEEVEDKRMMDRLLKIDTSTRNLRQHRLDSAAEREKAQAEQDSKIVDGPMAKRVQDLDEEEAVLVAAAAPLPALSPSPDDVDDVDNDSDSDPSVDYEHHETVRNLQNLFVFQLLYSGKRAIDQLSESVLLVAPVLKKRVLRRHTYPAEVLDRVCAALVIHLQSFVSMTEDVENEGNLKLDPDTLTHFRRVIEMLQKEGE